MATDHLLCSRLDQMIDLRDPLAALAQRMPWQRIEAALAPALTHKNRAGTLVSDIDLFGPGAQFVGSGVSAVGRLRLSIRLMASLLYLKHAFNLSDEELVERCAENVIWQFFRGNEYSEPQPPWDATQIGRFRTAIGEDGVVELLKATIDTAVVTKAVRPNEFERVIVDSSVQGKAIAFPTDSRLLEIARHKVVTAAKSAGIALKQTFAREGKTLRRRTGGYAHAKQYKWLRRALKRQRAALRIVLREAPRKIATATTESGATPHRLQTMMEHAERIRTQRPKDKGKLYAMLAPEVEGICKGNARQPYKFGATASIAVTHRRGLIVGARTFQGNPYDGHILSAQLEQTSTLLDDLDRAPKQIVLDLGCRGVDTDNP